MRRSRGDSIDNHEKADKDYQTQQDANAFLSAHVVRIRAQCRETLIQNVATRLQRYQDIVKQLRDERPKLEEFDIESETFFEPVRKDDDVVFIGNNNNDKNTTATADEDALVLGKSVLDTNVVKQVIAASPASPNATTTASATNAAEQQEPTVTPAAHTAFLKSLHTMRSTTANAAAAKSSSSSVVVQAVSNGQKSKSETAASRIAKVLSNNNSSDNNNKNGGGVTVYTTSRIKPHSHSPLREDDADGSSGTNNNNNNNASSSNNGGDIPATLGGGTITRTTNLVNKTISHSSPYMRTLPKKPKPPLPILSTSNSPTTETAGYNPPELNSTSSNSNSVADAVDGALPASVAAISNKIVSNKTSTEFITKKQQKKASLAQMARAVPRFLSSLSKKERREFMPRGDEVEVRVNTKRTIWKMPPALEPLLPKILYFATLLRKEALEMIAVFQELGGYILLSAGPVGRDSSRFYHDEIEAEDANSKDREVGDVVISNSILMVGALLALAGHRAQVMANLLKIERQNPISVHMVSTFNQGIAQMMLASWDYLHKGFTTMRRLTCLMHNLVGKNWESLENLHKMNELSQRVGHNLNVVASLKRGGGSGARFKKSSGKN